MTHHKQTRPRPFQCVECGKRMTLRQAERATYGNGCPKCGGADIDVAPLAQDDVGACGRASCAGYKPDGNHELAF